MEQRYELRRAALTRLIEKIGHGAIARVAKDIGVEPNYVSRLLYPPNKAGRKNIGEATADKITAAYPSWMDEYPVERNATAISAEEPAAAPCIAIVSDIADRRKPATSDPNERLILDAYRKASPELKRIMIANARETLALFGKRSEEK